MSCATATAAPAVAGLGLPPPNGCRRLRVRVRTIRSPYFDNIAGSTVSDAIIVISTAKTEAIASPYRKLTPVANIPSRAIVTVVPASRIARPDVSIASTTDCSTFPFAR